MEKANNISKVFAVIALIAASIWIGSYLTRLFIIYQLFEGPDLILKSFISELNISGILSSLLPAIVTHNIAFLIMIPSVALFFISSKISLRFNGWLFIILIAIVITLPFEIYLMLIDYKIITLLNSNTFDSNLVIQLLRDRIKDLSSFSLVAIFTYVSFFFFIVFQPLTKNKVSDHENK